MLTKVEMNDGYWWGLLRNNELIAVKFSTIQPGFFDFGISTSSANLYDVIPIIIRQE